MIGHHMNISSIFLKEFHYIKSVQLFRLALGNVLRAKVAFLTSLKKRSGSFLISFVDVVSQMLVLRLIPLFKQEFNDNVVTIAGSFHNSVFALRISS